MKIDNSYNPALVMNGLNKVAARTTENSASAQTSKVQLSSLAASMSGGSEEGAPIDQGRVEEIKLAISSGQFKINAGAIADSLLATAKELVQTQRTA